MAFTGLAISILSGTAHASFVASRIIDEGVYEDVSSMTSSQIDTFLNTFQYSCISPNSGFQARVPSGYSPSGGFVYGDYGTAGQVISTAASVYGLSPKVLLATLEKEQSLVTGRSSSSYCSPADDNNHKYAAAVGYGCPDSTTKYSYSGLDLYRRNGVTQTDVGPTCVNGAAKAGFSQQLIRAAWLLKFGEERSKGNINWGVIKGNWDNSDDPLTCYGGPMTQGTFKRCPGGTSTYFDGYTTIDNTSTHMDNGAAAALYWYTPHTHGNQLFVSTWEGWFGANSTFIPSFAWQEIGMSIMNEGKTGEIPTDSMHSGERLYVQIAVKNTGSVTWTRDGANPLRLGTVNPENVPTPYCDTTWISCIRPAAIQEATVATGGIGHFNFYMAVPNTPGVYRQYFEPLAENQSWMSNDAGFNIYVRTTNQYDWQWVTYDAWTDQTKTTPVNIADLARNQQIYIVLHTKNRSATTWDNTGPNPVTLGTSNPQDRVSVVCTPSWISTSCNRAALLSESSVAPGQDATFTFALKTPNKIGEFREFFKPVLEYKGWTRDDGSHIYLNVTH